MYTEYLGPIEDDNVIASHALLERAARLLQQGELVAFPTETIYGLGASILNESALKRLFQVKNRPAEQAFPILVANLDQVKFVARDIPPAFDLLAKAFLPGPLTIVLKKNPQLNSSLCGGKDTVAVRMSSNPIAQRLAQLTGCPLAVPSANVTGKVSPTKAAHVLEDFNGKIQAIVDGGAAKHGLESTIISLENPDKPVILRLGVVTKRDIEKVLGHPVMVHSTAMLAKNGAYPHPAVRLFSSWEEMRIYLQLSTDSKRLIMSCGDTSPIAGRCDHFKLFPSNLYDGLRLADRDGYAEVLVLCNPPLKQEEVLISRLKQIAST